MFDLFSATTATTSIAKFTITTSTEIIRTTAPGPGPSGVAIATLVIAGVASVASLFVAPAAYLKIRSSSKDAKEAADASREAAREAAAASKEAARTAADALKETTRLVAQLADQAELQRWQRDELRPLLARFLAASYAHRRSIDTLLGPRANRLLRNHVAVAIEQLQDIEILEQELALVCGSDVGLAADKLCLLHLSAAAEYEVVNPSRSAVVGAEFVKKIDKATTELVIAARAELGTEVSHGRPPSPPPSGLSPEAPAAPL